MAIDKAIDSGKETACRTAEANAIRAKTGGTAQISYDFANNQGFAAAIASIPSEKQEQSKTLTLGASAPQTVTPDSGKVLSSVPVSLDTSVIKAENIAKDVQMLGIVGTHEGGGEGMIPPFAYQSSTISKYSGNETGILDSAFYSCSRLTSVSFPVASYIGANAFMYCRSLKTASFPVASYIGEYAFGFCESLTSASFPMASYIGKSAFVRCSSFTTVSFPMASYIGSYAFYSCSRLTSVSFPVASYIGDFAFGFCISLTSANFPVTSFIGQSAFASCSSLTSVSFPVASYIGDYAFISCYSLTTASIPVASRIGSSTFAFCFSLTSVSFPVASYIGSYAFRNCFNLRSLTLRSTSFVSLAASNAFSSTPIAGYTASTGGKYGSIYVPNSMLASYRTRTNWSFFSSRFAGV